MDSNYTGDLLKHLEKQNELLKEARRTMQQELQKLEVEEHMLMYKFCELMDAHPLNKKRIKKAQNVSAGKGTT